MAAILTTVTTSDYSTSVNGTFGAPTPSTFTGPTQAAVAILTADHTTLTAYEVESTTGLAVVDGTTLTWRHGGITLADGEVVSLGFGGLEDSTTTDSYQVTAISGPTTTPTSRGTVVITKSSTTLTSTKGVKHTGSPTSKTSSATASAASTSSSGTAPSIGAGKALALLGALGGMVAYGL